jgi:ribonuclease E
MSTAARAASAKDAETNAYKTNIEAVEAICRQLRLRDIGGIVINDLIDMRQAKNRKAIEGLFRDRLKRDRAKTTIAPISAFGILEMTRQRMRGSLRSQHYTECPTCHGKGLVQRPSSVASDALREVAVLLEHEEVDRVELVVSGRIAGELLSNRRGSLNRIERSLGKQVEVRVSDTLGLDRFSIYAYDRNGADVGPEKLPKHRSPETELEVVETAAAEDGWALDPAETAAETDDDAPLAPDAPTPHPIELEVGEEMQSAEGETKKKRRRRRRKKKPGEGEATGETTGQTGGQTAGQSTPADAPRADAPSTDRDPDAEERAGEPGAAEGDGTKKKRRRRRRKKKSGDAPAGVDRAMGAEPGAQPTATDDDADEDAPEHEAESDEPATDTPPGDDHPDAQPKKKRRRSRRKKKPAGDMVAEGGEHADTGAQTPAQQPDQQPGAEQDDAGADGPTKVKKGRRRKKPGERSASSVEPRPAEASAPHSTPERAPHGAPQTAPRSGPQTGPHSAPERTPAPVTLPKKPRTLYGASRRRLGPSGIPRSRDE